MNIDLYSKIPGSDNFYWHEALYCRSWGVYVFPDQKQYDKIISFTKKVELVRAILNAAMHVSSWLRPKKYNNWPVPYGIRGAKFSYHPTGGAIDFRISGISADEVRAILHPYLKTLGLRMENLPGSSWIHLDEKITQGKRFFNP